MRQIGHKKEVARKKVKVARDKEQAKEDRFNTLIELQIRKDRRELGLNDEPSNAGQSTNNEKLSYFRSFLDEAEKLANAGLIEASVEDFIPIHTALFDANKKAEILLEFDRLCGRHNVQSQKGAGDVVAFLIRFMRFMPK